MRTLTGNVNSKVTVRLLLGYTPVPDKDVTITPFASVIFGAGTPNAADSQGKLGLRQLFGQPYKERLSQI
jgi:hypothetical protein